MKSLWIAVLCVVLAACQKVEPPLTAEERIKVDAELAIENAARAKTDPFAPQERDKNGEPMFYSVVPYGYNYTDAYIDSFKVNGAGGGNLEVSIPTGGGGGSVCCTSLYSGMPKGQEFVIKWARDRERWCQQTVKLNDPVPIGARYLEVHFYQDGHIEVFPSKEASFPRLKLERFDAGNRHETGNVINDEKFSTCKNVPK